MVTPTISPIACKRVQQERGEDQFHTFYRYFLLKLFHEGLSKREACARTRSTAGQVPYLNGGLFDVHELERANPEIPILTKRLSSCSRFFDEFDWHLDDRPLRSDNEINPDVLGYIFEKYINQKQMGAYYTKEDITEYISKNTIIPFLLDAAEQKCQIAFRPDGPVWSLLRENPDAYIYDAVKKGYDMPLPPDIEAGLHDVAQRGEWNKPAPEDYALPTEIWREVVARRTRYQDIRAKLAAGEITSINDLITYNLDIVRFAEDVITYCKGLTCCAPCMTASRKSPSLTPPVAPVHSSSPHWASSKHSTRRAWTVCRSWSMSVSGSMRHTPRATASLP